MVFMNAIVLRVMRDRLLVLDLASRRQVIVITPQARRFRTGNVIRIRFNGVMTRSNPPQIIAERITLVSLNSIWCGWR